MVKQTIYPSGITPKVKKRCKGDDWELNKDSCKEIQPLSPDYPLSNVCEDSNKIISWGEINPDAVDHNDPVYSSNFYNTVTTFSGSYDTPTAFTTNGWKDISDVSNTAKIKSIHVQYCWDQVRYGYDEHNNKNNHVTWEKKGNVGFYQSAGGYFPSSPTLTLKIGGKTLSKTGFNVRSASSCTRRNAGTYTEDQLKKGSIEINGVSGLTMGQFKKSKLTFTPTKNHASDVTRIVMRYIRVVVNYEDDAKFNLSSITASPSKITNCDDDYTVLTVKVKGVNKSAGKTTVKLNGSGIVNGTKKKAILSKGDSLKKVKNKSGTYDWLWTIGKNCTSRTLKVHVAYKNAGTYKINATVTSKAGPTKTKSAQVTVQECKPVFSFDFLTATGAKNTKFKYSELEADANLVQFRLKLTKSQTSSHNENITFDTDGLKFNQNDDWVVTTDTGTYDLKNVKKQGNIYTFNKINRYKSITITRKTKLDESGLYHLIGSYNNITKKAWNQSKSYDIEVVGSALPKDYFKLRLEDGSDVKYNYLMVTEGDDLLKPITYTSEEIDAYLSQMKISGETKRIPVNETQYIHFDIELSPIEETVVENGQVIKRSKDIELKNVLTYIDVYNQDYDLSEIIMGTGENVQLLDSNESILCSIKSISSVEPTTVKIAVKSTIEADDVIVKIKPYNYDGYNEIDKWIPTHIMFKDIPNIKLSIEGISDLIYDESVKNNPDSYFWLYYNIENLSDVTAENVRFQLKEPSVFKKICYQFEEDNDCDNQQPTITSGAWFNKNNRILTFPTLEAHSAKRILAVKYKATRKGIYNFVIHTLDDEKDLKDDQYQNSCTHTLMVNIPNEVRITTDVSKKLPYRNELIDFHIKVKNLYKKQNTFKFDIYDVGGYENNHPQNDYCIEHVQCKNGIFTPMPDKNYNCVESHNKNLIGTWTLTDIGINDEYHLTISARPKDIGNHVFKTIFTDEFENTKHFYNEVKVLESNKQLDFNVYHAVNEKGNDCSNCEDLTEICDDDFINLGDDIYYVFKIKNNNRNSIKNALHVYARLPESFLSNDILCSSYPYIINKESNLISFTIPSLPGCNHEDKTFTFCIKVKPSKAGKFISNFTLSTRNSRVLHKQLKLTVDTEFAERKLEHSITIYNFEKTNRNYRYEIDNVGEIFKFFNTKDKSLRQIEFEPYNKSSIEHYKGLNLRELVKKIQRTSKYVDPVFLRTGSNRLANKGYELFPDGLIRRFGLLNSEVYHYSGQFPITSDLVDRAMKWGIDTWDTKLWAGDIYDNGVFDLAIDYSKIPSNFDILNVENPIKNLQNLVDNVKPYGTKATITANLRIDIVDVYMLHGYNVDIHLTIPDSFDVITHVNRYDNTDTVYHDLAKVMLKSEIKKLIGSTDIKDSNKINANVKEIVSHIYADKISKQKAKNCYQLIADKYNVNEQKNNIDIIKPYTTDNYEDVISDSLSNIQVLNFSKDSSNDLEGILLDKESKGLKITPLKDASVHTHNNTPDQNGSNNNDIYCIYYRNDIEDFEGFQLILNDNIIQKRKINQTVTDVSIQVQTCAEGDKNVLHFWGSINKEDYYHIGLLVINDFNQPLVSVYNQKRSATERYNIDNKNDKEIAFKISNQINTKHKQFSSIKAIENKYKWSYLHRINENNNKYAYFINHKDIDPACDINNVEKVNVPKLALKYKDIDIDDLDEIIDIKFNIEAQTNKEKEAFAEGININVFKDGDKYVPENNISRELCYPSRVTNINQKLLTTMEVEQENITICNNCLKTSLGYYDICPHCESSFVQHANEPMAATACYNCGWIINGWDDYCHHCLSYDIEKIQIDYNKTYCTECGNLAPNYYERCPKCFSQKVEHLTNNVSKYQIFGEDTQNIEPINVTINMQDKPKDSPIRMFTLNVPFNYQTDELKKLEYLNLKIFGIDNNKKEYYYCDACKSGGIGNYDKCPHCGSDSVHNEQINNDILNVYYQANGDTILYNYMLSKTYNDINVLHEKEYNPSIIDKFEKTIDLQACAANNIRDTFSLIFDVDKQEYNTLENKILSLDIKEECQDAILQELSMIDVTIDNLSLDYKYKNEQEWIGLDQMEGLNHTGISYKVPNNTSESESISFDNFNIETGDYKHAYLSINGVLKDISDSITMDIKIINGGDIYYKQDVVITDTLFNYTYDIINKTNEHLNNVSIELIFKDCAQNSEIIITNCDILVEKVQYKDNLDIDINKKSSNYIQEDNSILLSSKNELWGINQLQPYYLSGHQLKTNLVAYIDFGTLNLDEYIRVYNIDMIISYKAKNGFIVTETISQEENNQNIATETTSSNNHYKTYRTILKAVGYTDEQIDNNINNDISLTQALNSKHFNIDKDETQQIVNGDINVSDAFIWGSIIAPREALNNLESETTNINEDDELVSSIPLRYKLAQAFNTGDNRVNNISTIYLDYFGKAGYPSDIINIYLCKDIDGLPGSIISSNKIYMPNVSSVINVDLNTYNLSPNTQYWIVLEDMSANKNNYHKFNYNNGNYENPLIGPLALCKDVQYSYESSVLSFGIDKIHTISKFYNLPQTWHFNNDMFDGYKIHNIFYKFNIQDGSNAILSNFVIKNGYAITDENQLIQQSTNTTLDNDDNTSSDDEIYDNDDIVDSDNESEDEYVGDDDIEPQDDD